MTDYIKSATKKITEAYHQAISTELLRIVNQAVNEKVLSHLVGLRAENAAALSKELERLNTEKQTKRTSSRRLIRRTLTNYPIMSVDAPVSASHSPLGVSTRF